MKNFFRFSGLLLVTILVVVSNPNKMVFGEENSDEILNVLIKGEQFQSSLFKTGKGSMLFEVLAEQRKENGTIETRKLRFNVVSVFDGSKIKLEKKLIPYSKDDRNESLEVGTELIYSDGNNIKHLFSDRKILEVGSISLGDKRNIQDLLPLHYGKSFVYLYPSYKLSVIGKVMVDSSSCYVVEGILKGNRSGKNYQLRAEAIIDPQCGYLTRSLKMFVKSDTQKEILVQENTTVPKEYANGIWAPYESTETVYSATNPNDAENTKYIAEKISMKIIEYSFNIALNPKDSEINVPAGTTIHDLSSDIIITP